ncbi:glycosyltransferase family 2 protein [Microbacterium sp. NPDC087665]|uniref:glycosyltransferase family 2 protein n=1 Tax=Microbacterium sp. NPDC087665 TaxID=3364194 RepID=UPI00380A8F22
MTSEDPVLRPLVSIIVPVYNSGAHLLPCVRSILAQTHAHLELILIDDGSTDDSGALCDRLAQEDSRVIVRHQANGGIAAAQNAGLDIASGALITFCDNDDLMAPRMLERLVDLIESTGADMSCCRWRNVGASQGEAELAKHSDDAFGTFEVFGDPGKAYQTVFSVAVRRLFRKELKYFSEANWGKLYRSHLFEGVRFPAGRYAQDVAVAMTLYERMSTVVSCSDALYYWLQRGDSVSHAVKSTSYYSDIVHAHLTSFDVALRLGITPARAFSGLKTLRFERRSAKTEQERAVFDADVADVRRRTAQLSFWQLALCELLYLQRALEVQVYNRTIHRRR